MRLGQVLVAEVDLHTILGGDGVLHLGGVVGVVGLGQIDRVLVGTTADSGVIRILERLEFLFVPEPEFLALAQFDVHQPVDLRPHLDLGDQGGTGVDVLSNGLQRGDAALNLVAGVTSLLQPLTRPVVLRRHVSDDLLQLGRVDVQTVLLEPTKELVEVQVQRRGHVGYSSTDLGPQDHAVLFEVNVA